MHIHLPKLAKKWDKEGAKVLNKKKTKKESVKMTGVFQNKVNEDLVGDVKKAKDPKSLYTALHSYVDTMNQVAPQLANKSKQLLPPNDSKEVATSLGAAFNFVSHVDKSVKQMQGHIDQVQKDWARQNTITGRLIGKAGDAVAKGKDIAKGAVQGVKQGASNLAGSVKNAFQPKQGAVGNPNDPSWAGDLKSHDFQGIDKPRQGSQNGMSSDKSPYTQNNLEPLPNFKDLPGVKGTTAPNQSDDSAWDQAEKDVDNFSPKTQSKALPKTQQSSVPDLSSKFANPTDHDDSDMFKDVETSAGKKKPGKNIDTSGWDDAVKAGDDLKPDEKEPVVPPKKKAAAKKVNKEVDKDQEEEKPKKAPRQAGTTKALSGADNALKRVNKKK